MGPMEGERELTASPDPARRAQRESGARTAWAVIVGIIGAIGIFITIGGFVAIGANALLRDDQGFFTTGDEELYSAGYAITSGDFNVEGDTAGVDLGGVASFQLEAENTRDRPLFLGIGPSDDVDRYLAGVAHSEVDDFSRRGNAVYTQVDGGRPRTPPAAQPFWIAQSAGLGRQRIEWDLDTGSLTAVAMNADGSQIVRLTGEAGVKLAWLLWAGIALILIGFAISIACGFGMNRLLRSPPKPEPGAGAAA